MPTKTDAEYAAMTLPKRGTCLVTDDEAIMTIDYFDALLEYSSSLPTGTYIGKRWKRFVGRGDQRWMMGEYAEDPDPEKVLILWRRITQVSPEGGREPGAC